MAAEPASTSQQAGGFGVNLLAALRDIVIGLAIALVAANIWPLFLLNLGAPPLASRATRGVRFRRGSLSPSQWIWGLVAAFSFAATVHAAIVLLFRLVPALDVERVLIAAEERKGEGRRSDSRRGLQLLQQLLGQRDPGLGLCEARVRQRQIDGEDPGGANAGIGFGDMEETAEQESRAHEEDQSE